MKRSRFFAKLTGDHRRLAEIFEANGAFERAADELAKAGELRRAAATAAKAGAVGKAIRYAFEAALEPGWPVPKGATAQQAGEVLAAAGLTEEALVLFELGRAWLQAAETASKLKQPLHAAKLYERAQEYDRAAAIYERSDRPADALRALELESKRLAEKSARQRDPAAARRRRRSRQGSHTALR